MSRLQTVIAALGVTAAVAAVAAMYRVNPLLGLSLLVAAGVAGALYLMRDDIARVLDRDLDYLGRPAGRLGLAMLGIWIVTAPAVLFFDPATFAPNRYGHINRDPREFYQLVSDDVAYVAASRTWDRTVASLLVPHNTHIVPAWRILTWTLVVAAGNLENLPAVFPMAAYGILVAVMLMTGRLVARETGNTTLGLAASALVGTTSVMLTPAIWYSGGQPLWASFAILSSLWYAQSYRRDGRWRGLILSAAAASVAGGLWAAGHLAGPVAAVSLWFDGRPRCRRAAAVPLLATAATVVVMLAFVTRPMDSRVSFHGRSVGEAANPIQGAITTAQSIPETLVLANLGLAVETTPIQGIVMTLTLVAIWACRRWRRTPTLPVNRLADAAARGLKASPGVDRTADRPTRLGFAFNPMETAGAALVVGCYLIEWTFRGYLDHHNLRTISAFAIVPWYDVIPQVGAVLFAIGWWSGPRHEQGHAPRPVARRASMPRRSAVLILALTIVILIVLNRPRVDALIRGTVPSASPSEQAFFKVPHLLTMRAGALMSTRVNWQRKYLRRLDQVEPIARRMGIGQDGIRAAFGFVFIPGTTGRLLQDQRENYDVAAILNLPAQGRNRDVAAIRAALGNLLRVEPEPRPPWLAPGEKWPPD